MSEMNIAAIGALVGDQARVRMLTTLFDGRALTATELAAAAGVTPATASSHLSKLTKGGLLTGVSQGRHRYFRIASREVASMLEGIMVVAAEPSPAGTRAAPKIDPALRAARTCYDHIAGRLGVALADSLVTRGAILLGDGAGEVTADGQDFLRAFGVPEKAPRGSRRLYCRACLDWSERRIHLSGVLGAALLARCEELGWVVRALDSRALMVTKLGERGFARTFNVQI
jgi:DNA-binding transcriptional ArsR family regulator